MPIRVASDRIGDALAGNPDALIIPRHGGWSVDPEIRLAASLDSPSKELMANGSRRPTPLFGFFDKIVPPDRAFATLRAAIAV
jgi:hypothetical protein